MSQGLFLSVRSRGLRFDSLVLSSFAVSYMKDSLASLLIHDSISHNIMIVNSATCLATFYNPHIY